MVMIDAALDKYSLPYLFLTIIYADSVQTGSIVIVEFTMYVLEVIMCS